ncbi:hypothetical protein [Chlorobium ferrooxidans]|nr:hypothetical protein [Chlorobium ferrooxidans]
MSTAESSEFDKLKEIVNEEERAEPVEEKSPEEEELETLPAGKAGGKGG